ncbi:hypothetical protein EV193_105474 [Herbihabitans rhizosphaerae]|uniref:Secretory lipase n=2 Tax=Herbihabitans rhizosphaerae TaxID=1872711 RepID=A0A4Q7KNG2_9PSEU|nr:hypothetical protein EV193_105474 [Herbihabitans rhizosphaerae]
MKPSNTKAFRRAAIVTAAGTAAATALAIAVPTASAAPAPVTGQDRGTLLSVEQVIDLDRAQVTDALMKQKIDTSQVRSSVTGYRLTYSTVDLDGRPTTATGLVVVPNDSGPNLQVVSQAHGTLSERHAAPSSAPTRIAGSPALFYGSAGHLTVAPDYLGLGSGPGPHPYMHSPTEVSASLDLLRATRAFADRHGLQVDPDTLVTGSSQGGRVATALGRELRRGADRFWRLGALAPVAGPYDIIGAQTPAMLDGQVEGRPTAYTLAYYTVAANRRLHLWDSPSEAFQAPYAAKVESWFDGDHPTDQIIAQLPDDPMALFTPKYQQLLRQPTGKLGAEIRAGDRSCSWRASAPVRLYTSSGDRNVVLANSEHCRDDLAKRGADVTMVDLGPDVTHFAAATVALPRILDWWRGLR